jgi:hypothetical protein
MIFVGDDWAEDADSPRQFGITHSMCVLVAIDQLDEARGCHTAKYSAKV